MLDQKDLALIAGVVAKVVDEKFSSIMEHQLMPQFELIHAELAKRPTREEVKDIVDTSIASAKTNFVTKGFLEERLDKFAGDHRLRYRPT